MLLLTLLTALAGAQTPPMPRDPSAQTVKPGTAAIRGRVTSAETGFPLRRAFVMLSGGPPSTAKTSDGPVRPRTIATNEDGRFQFTALRAGTYRLNVSPGNYRGQYLSRTFGSRKPMDGGQPIELQDGQVFQADVALPRGAAIVGRVIDEFGEPIARASVYPMRAMPGGKLQRTGGGFYQTDDLGRFRLYGIEPGDYAVAVEPRGMGGPPVDGPSEGFMTTFYPSTYNERDASRVRVAGPGDVGDLEIHVIRTRTFRITGTILDSQGRPGSAVGVQLVQAPPGSGGSGFGASGGGDQDGKFTIRDVVPGNYRLIVRPVTYGPPPPPQPSATPREYANVPLSVGADIEDLVVVTQVGASVPGRVVFAEGAPPEPLTGLRVNTQPAERAVMYGPGPNATVGANLQFKLDDLFEPQHVRLAGLPPRYAVKAIMLGQTDVTDTAVEFKAAAGRSLQIVVTSRISTLEGTVASDSGEPPSAMVIMFPEDKSSWKLTSTRIRMTGMLKDGKFKLPTVLPGRYYVVAWPRERASFGDDANAEYFEILAKEATVVVMAEDEQRTIDLRLAKDPRER